MCIHASDSREHAGRQQKHQYKVDGSVCSILSGLDRRQNGPPSDEQIAGFIKSFLALRIVNEMPTDSASSGVYT